MGADVAQHTKAAEAYVTQACRWARVRWLLDDAAMVRGWCDQYHDKIADATKAVDWMAMKYDLIDPFHPGYPLHGRKLPSRIG